MTSSGPLHGWTVGVTADRRSAEQTRLLERHGARAMHGPLLRVVPHSGDEKLGAAVAALVARPPDVVVLTTGVGTRAWFEEADAAGRGEDLRAALAGAEVLARGAKASAAAATEGLETAWRAPGGTSEELVERLAGVGVRGRRIAVQLDGRADPVLGDAIRALGADVVDVPVYRWLSPEDPCPGERLVEAVAEGRLDAVTFTSAPAVWRLFELAADAGLTARVRDRLAESVVVSVGPVCSRALREAGAEPTVEPARHRLGPMILALAAHAAATDDAAAVEVGGHRVVLHATTVVVGERVVELSARERGLLAALLERPGAVVDRDGLLRRGGFAGDASGHAVEVAVTRLRRRLAGALEVASVPRRGYRLDPPRPVVPAAPR